MVGITIENMVKRFGDVRAVDHVSLRVAAGELFFLLGPSGCGKTTLLRLLAGFYHPDAGRILFGDREMTDVPPHKRRTGMVFQNYALWPHMTVAGNVAFGPKAAGRSRSQCRQVVSEMLALVDMEDRRHHKPTQLSGGQQQRVALARALAVRPRGLLLDEPLSNLDARLRVHMRAEIRRLVKDAGATAVYVTHDQDEALSMADRIAVMADGRVVQVGRPREIYRRPANRFVAEFLGEANFLTSTVAGRRSGGVLLDTPAGRIRADGGEGLADGATVTCCVRPEAVALVPGAGVDVENTLSARCIGGTYLGSSTRVQLVLDGGEGMQALVMGEGAELRPGERTEVRFAAADVVVFPG